MLTVIAFYTLAAVAIASAVMFVIARDLVLAALWFPLVFYSIVGLNVLLGAELLGVFMVLFSLIAAAGLFLLSVFALGGDPSLFVTRLRAYDRQIRVMGGILFFEVVLILGHLFFRSDAVPVQPELPQGVTDQAADVSVLTSTQLIALVGAVLVLITAVIGAISLTSTRRNALEEPDFLDVLYKQGAGGARAGASRREPRG
ncbi:MAG: NADH-quinone oxidoreductase subunit J [Pseudomonadota bacterium]